jgi:undecaprenyl-diphosphatase
MIEESQSLIRSLDLVILETLNLVGTGRETLTAIIGMIAGNHMFKGGFIMMLFWGAWFHYPQGDRRLYLIGTVGVACVAIAVGRLLALLLPFRTRPIFDPSLTLYGPSPDSPGSLAAMSALPSDHAVLYFALATGLFLVSRPLGVVALLHAALVVSMPRIMLGLHFPTDILSGAIVGTVIAFLLCKPVAWVAGRIGVLDLEESQPGLFYALMFAVTLQMATMFDPLRAVLRVVWTTLG